MSTDQNNPSSEKQEGTEDGSELLISMSYEAITYLERAIPVYKKIATDLGDDEKKNKEALDELGKAEDGLKWLALYAHECIEAEDNLLTEEIREKFKPFKQNLLPGVRKIVGELEKVDKSALPTVISDHMLPLFSELHLATKDTLEHLGKNFKDAD